MVYLANVNKAISIHANYDLGLSHLNLKINRVYLIIGNACAKRDQNTLNSLSLIMFLKDTSIFVHQDLGL